MICLPHYTLLRIYMKSLMHTYLDIYMYRLAISTDYAIPQFEILWSKVYLLSYYKLPAIHKIKRVSIHSLTMHSIVMCWFLFGIIFTQSFVYIDAVSADGLTLIQLEKMVVELKASHEIQCHKLSEIQSENSHFKEKMKEIYEDNKQLKGKIRDLLDENREQKKINSQFKKEITEIKTLLKSSEFKELFKLKSTLLKSKTVADQDWHLNDDNKSVKTIGTNSFKSGINKKTEAVNTSGRTSTKRLLLTTIFFYYVSCFYINISNIFFQNKDY